MGASETAFEAGSVELSQDRFCQLRRSLKIWLDAKQRMFRLRKKLNVFAKQKFVSLSELIN